MAEIQDRQVAYKVGIRDILGGEYKVQEGWNPNYVLTKDGRKISRANLIASIIDKRETDNFGSITVDDSTASINVNVFADNLGILKDKQIGDLVLVIGRPRMNNNQIQINAEIIRKLDNPEWARLRKLELENIKKELEKNPPVQDAENKIKDEKTENKSAEQEIIEEMHVEEKTEREKMASIINNLDQGEGASTELVVKHYGNGADGIINELLKEGEIFETKPGRLKVL